jgi:hypothetical protein
MDAPPSRSSLLPKIVAIDQHDITAFCAQFIN